MAAAIARIENTDRSPHAIQYPGVDGGDPTYTVIPAGRRNGQSIVPGVLPVATKAELDELQKRLGKALTDDGSTVLRLVRV